MDTQWVEANGVQLRYDYCQRRAPTVVLVHEMGGTLESYDAIVPALARKWGVLRYDQRGAGLSEKINGSLSIDTPADDLAALLDALAIAEPVAVVGCAVGAAVAVRFAARHAARVDALVLLAPATSLAEERRPTALKTIEAIEQSGIRATFETAAPAQRGRYETLRMIADPRSLAATWRMLVHLDLEEDLAALSCPTLVAAGQRDTARPPEWVAGVAGKIPNARLLTLDTGHVMAIDTPELIVATLTDFLSEVGFRSGFRRRSPSFRRQSY